MLKRLGIIMVLLSLPVFGFLLREKVVTKPVLHNEVLYAAERTVRVPILVYHNIRPPSPTRVLSASDQQYEVTPEQFESELAVLAKEKYTVVSFDQMMTAIHGGENLPEKSVVITIDDGRESQYLYALPLLKKYGFSATFFIFTNAIGKKGYLTWDQLKELHDEGMAIEAHTRFHPFLTRITDDAELRKELTESKKLLEDKLGISVKYFAYPFGLYDDRVVAAVKDAGYSAARGLRHTVVAGPENVFSLGGFIATGDIGYFRSAILGAKK